MENLASWKRLDNDVNGNPRYYIPGFLVPDKVKVNRLKYGLTLYRGKQYGHGYVMQSYALANDIRDILNSEGL